jgi:ATP-dependent DNA helicase RecG
MLIEGNRIESERIEFKETWDARASLKTVCAFANDLNNWGGGYIVIGVRELSDGTKQSVGIPAAKADAWMKDILNKCKLITPAYMPIVDVAEHEGKTFLVLWCPGGSTRPYSAPKTLAKGDTGRVRWIRRVNSTIQPSAEEERDLYTLANNVPYDDQQNHTAELADLNLLLIKSYLKSVDSALYSQADTMPFEDLCRNMHIAAGPPEHLRPINVGLMFFSLQPDAFFPYAQIDVVEFPTGEAGDTIIEHTFKGPLDRQLAEALLYLSNAVVEETVIKSENGAPSERFFNYPKDALKEALANAVYHKGYDSREPIEVRVLPDRIEILSHPGADRSISIEGLKNYRLASRRYRNRRIGEFLKELGLTEGRNTGVHKMLKSLKDNGSPAPLFETDEERLYFMVTIYARSSKRVSAPEGSSRAEKMQIRREAVREYFAVNPDATIAKASAELGIPRATLNRDIAALKK